MTTIHEQAEEWLDAYLDDRPSRQAFERHEMLEAYSAGFEKGAHQGDPGPSCDHELCHIAGLEIPSQHAEWHREHP